MHLLFKYLKGAHPGATSLHMTINLDNSIELETHINSQKMRGIVIDVIQQMLPHIKNASIPEMMVAYAVIIKATLMVMGLSERDKDLSKALLDAIWSQVLVDSSLISTQVSAAIH